MNTTTTRVKEPQQERSRESLERVYEAALATLLEEGWHDFTLAHVCERAGVTVGMLYRRFRGRDELLAALQNRWIDESEASTDELRARAIDWKALDFKAAVHTAVHGLAESFRVHEVQTRVFGLHGAFDEAGLTRLQAVSRNLSAWYRDGLWHHRRAIVHPRPRQAIDFSFRLVLDTMIRRTTHGDEFDTGTPAGSWDDFADELCTVCLAYLFGVAPTRA